MSAPTILRYTLLGLTMAASPMVTHTALAEMIPLKAELKGSNEVNPNDSKGTGTFTATYDTDSKKLTWKGKYSGLSGPARMAHFHGPIEPNWQQPQPFGDVADVTVIIPEFTSPFEGSATLTDAQAAELLAGKWYVNIHTDAYPAGEVRGQVLRGK
jgi:hypothetical protein